MNQQSLRDPPGLKPGSHQVFTLGDEQPGGLPVLFEPELADHLQFFVIRAGDHVSPIKKAARICEAARKSESTDAL